MSALARDRFSPLVRAKQDWEALQHKVPPNERKKLQIEIDLVRADLSRPGGVDLLTWAYGRAVQAAHEYLTLPSRQWDRRFIHRAKVNARKDFLRAGATPEVAEQFATLVADLDAEAVASSKGDIAYRAAWKQGFDVFDIAKTYRPKEPAASTPKPPERVKGLWQQIMDYLATHPDGAGPTEIARAIKRSPRAVRDELNNLMRSGRVSNLGNQKAKKYVCK